MNIRNPSSHRQPVRLAPAWRRWLMESLMMGVAPGALVPALAKSGLGRRRARAAIQAEIDSPLFRGSYRAACLHRKMRGLVGAYSHLGRGDPRQARVERREEAPPPEVFRRFLLRSRPLVIRDGLPALAAGGIDLRRPRVRFGAQGPRAAPRLLRSTLLLYQVRGRRRIQLVPWHEYFAVAAGSGEAPGAGAAPAPLELEVAVEEGEVLLLPVGWWYRFLGRDGGVAVTFEIAGEGEPVIRTAGRPPPIGRPDPRPA